MTDPTPHPRWYRLTSSRLLLGPPWPSRGFCGFRSECHWIVSIKGWPVVSAVEAVGVFFLLMFLWFLAALVFRWRFQFSILSLLVLVVAVALPFSWLATEMKAAKEQREVAAWVKKMQRPIYYDYDVTWTKRESPILWWKFSEPRSQGRLGSILGDDFFATVTAVNLNWAAASNADVERLRGLPGLRLCSSRRPI